MVSTPKYDLDTDTTLGGNNASDYVSPSQKAIKAYVDNHSSGAVNSVNGQTGAVVLTASDVGAVDLTSDQSISSVKTFTDASPVSVKTTQDNEADAGFYKVRLNAVNSTTSPATETYGGMRIYSGDNAILGDFRSVRQTDGTQYSAMMARNAQSGTQVTAAIGVQVDANGDVSAYGTQNGKRAFANLAMPSSTSQDYTAKASGSSYTASFTGWVFAGISRSSANWVLAVSANGILQKGSTNTNNNTNSVVAFIPVKKGDSFTVNYSGQTDISIKLIKSVGDL